jgi:transcription elongation factor GreA
MAEKIKLTKAGLEKFQKEYRELNDVELVEIGIQIQEARAQGDLSENADYDAARKKQGEVEARIKQLEEILHNYELIDETGKKAGSTKVALGTTVTIKNYLTDTVNDYMIVSSVESDPVNGKISASCPLGATLIGKQVGDVVEVKAIKTYKVEIIKIGSK